MYAVGCPVVSILSVARENAHERDVSETPLCGIVSATVHLISAMSMRHPRAPVCHRPTPVVTRWYVAISHHRYAHHAHRRIVHPAFHRIPVRRLGARTSQRSIGTYGAERQKDGTLQDDQTYTELRDRGKSRQKSRVPSQSIQERQHFRTSGRYEMREKSLREFRIRTVELLCNIAVYHTVEGRCRVGRYQDRGGIYYKN
jgi:hypothetical protein